MSDADDALSELKPRENDLIVVPYDFKLPENPPFLTYKIKYLLKPSIIRSGVGSMNFFENLSVTKLLGMLTGSQNTQENKENSENTVERTARGGKAIPDKPNPQFFRYYRPLDEKNEYRFGPKGGVAFFVTLSAKTRELAFSYALCNNKDLFNKATARGIVKQRFDNKDRYLIKNYDPDLSALTNIKKAIELYSATGGDKNASIDNYPTLVGLSDRCNNYELDLVSERIY